ncbi:MAG: hypothetical protein ACLPY5_11175 [Candidatus Bathyarchaeia archaeon]
MRPLTVRAAFACCLVLMILGTCSVSYADTSTTSPPNLSVIIIAPNLSTSQTLPTDMGSNVSLIADLTGPIFALNGTVVIRSHSTSSTNNANACRAKAIGSVILEPSTNTPLSPAGVLILITGAYSSTPCAAGLQGQSFSLHVQVFSGEVTLSESLLTGGSATYNGQARVGIVTRPNQAGPTTNPS